MSRLRIRRPAASLRRAERIGFCLLLPLLALSTVEARSRKKPKAVAEESAPSAVSAPAATTSNAPASPSATQPAASAPAPSTNSGRATGDTTDPCLSDPKCNDLYERARLLSKAGQYDAALVLYQQTFAMRPLPWLLLNVGRMQQKLNRNDQALVTYRKILDWNAKQPADDQSNLADDEVLAKAREYRQQADDALAEQRRQNPVVVQTGPAVDKTPLYKKWWFWTIVGGTVAAVAVGVGLGVGLSTAATNAPGTARVPAGVPILTPTF